MKTLPMITLSFREARKLRVKAVGIVGFLDKAKQPLRVVELEEPAPLAMLFRFSEEYALVNLNHVSKF